MDFKDGDQFLQQFEELAFYADVRDNEQVMVAQIKRATHETSKHTIYVADGNLPTLYDQWKTHLLWIDYNWRLKQAEGMGWHVDSKPQMLRSTVPKGVASTSVSTQKTPSGTTYGGQGAPMDISAAATTAKCYRCGIIGHFKHNCPNAPKTREEALRRFNTYWDHHPTVEVMATVEEANEDAEK